MRDFIWAVIGFDVLQELFKPVWSSSVDLFSNLNYGTALFYENECSKLETLTELMSSNDTIFVCFQSQMSLNQNGYNGMMRAPSLLPSAWEG